MLDCVDEAFHEMAFPIPPAIIVPWLVGTRVRRDHGFRSTVSHQVDERLPGVAPIRNDAFKWQSLQQRRCVWAVMALPRRQFEAQRIAQAIDQDMDLGAKATTAPSQRLRIRRAVFFQRQRHRHAPEQWCCPGGHVPYRHH